MLKTRYRVVGVMSGTSLDGIDLAECYFEVQKGKWSFRFGATQTIPYTNEWQSRLKDAIHLSEIELQKLNESYTELLSRVILEFLTEYDISTLDAVCSHGHTILHQPQNGFTLQIGNLPILAKRINHPIVCDFRVQDVALGGQGAPLVPVGDQLLFGEYDYCLNLGGFANVSFLADGQRSAYDICPVNIVLNHYTQKMGYEYDEGGTMAASGSVLPIVLERLNNLPYYKLPPPKSLGLEWVLEHIRPILDQVDVPLEDVLRTFVEHIAVQLSNQFLPETSVLITGGGAYNTFLFERMQALSSSEFKIPTPQLIEFKEALLFGLLGVLKLREEINCYASVTGAVKDHSCGKIFHP